MDKYYRDELISFFIKKYNEIKNQNITKEQFLNWINQNQPNLTETERLAIIYSNFKNNLTSEEKDKVFDYFKNIENNIKTEDDFTVLIQNTKLKRDIMSNQEELIKNEGRLVTIPATPERGFNYSFMIYIPNTIDKDQVNNLIIHSCNTPDGILDYSKVEEYTRINQLKKDSIYMEMSNKGKDPLIMPIIPRFRGYNPEYIENGEQRGSLENFMFLQSELDSKYQMNKEDILKEYNKSQDIISQQMNMCDYAITYLKQMGINMDDKIIVEGHSAGSKNAASIINKYPERIESYVIGGTTGISKVNDNSIPGIVYNGVLDRNNPAEFYYDENGIARSKNMAAYSDEYMQNVVVPRYNKSLEEWKEENKSHDISEFNVVQQDIKKQHESIGDKGILVEGYGHNAVDSKIVREKAVEVVNNTKNRVNKSSRTNEINRLKKQRLELEKSKIQNTIQKENVKVLKLNNNGFINIVFISIIVIVVSIVIYINVFN